MDVLRKLRIKMIVSIVVVLMLVLAALFLTLDFSLTKAENDKTLNFLSQLALNDGHLPHIGPPGEDRVPANGSRQENNGLPDKAMPLDDKNMPEPREPRPDDFGHPVPPDEAFENNDSRNSMRSILSWLRLDSFGSFRNYFAVRITSDGSIVEIIRDFPLSYTDDEISQITKKIVLQEKDKGIYNGMFYLITHTSETSLVCVMNRQNEIATLYQLYSYSGLIYFISLFFAFLLAWFLSLWAIRPVAAAFEKQKRFIADAGHELKTPIAVISANIDVLLSDMPDNKWLQYIRDENERMSHLVKDLLFLARNDADRSVMHESHFNFTAAVNSAVLPFESVIFEQNKKLELNAAENMKCYGDESQIKQVIIVLVDNAIKNSEAGALIRVTAAQEGQKVVVKVYNTGRGIAESDLEKIFLRFYRADTSRVRETGGYGLGLAIAKTITEAHGGTLTVDSLYGSWAEFTLTLPVNAGHEKQKKESLAIKS